MTVSEKIKSNVTVYHDDEWQQIISMQTFELFKSILQKEKYLKWISWRKQ